MQKITKEQRNHLDDIVVDINSLTVKKIQLYIENGITIQELDQKSNNFYTFRGQFFGGLNYREAISVLYCHLQSFAQ